ncbi:DinB family protein [Stieleria sp. JC731]|uniref:DinB family protein n=1 Tax=Pirellulaceae TaxID=2691357 RepID=UPI001E4A7255|nr:DinB family protein [Stieleria sp. JC731]MCC9603678.1 DinB family protein [Stieleria sp. JC731]
MSTVDYIRRSLETSRMITLALIDDLKETPFQPPTSNGGNTPMWILGHLTYAEANIVEHIIKGNDNPLIDWKPVFGARQDPPTDESVYPSWDEVRTKFDAVRTQTLALLEGLSDSDLDSPTKNCPEGREMMFGTIGGCCMMMTMHPLMHYGQLADSRRMLGRQPLQA